MTATPALPSPSVSSSLAADEATDDADALVLFGVTGDLARKKLFPAVYRLAEKGVLGGRPIVGVASSVWSTEELRARMRQSLDDHGIAVSDALWSDVSSRVIYVQGDYRAQETYERLAAELDESRRPLVYLAVPPELFDDVIGGLSAVQINERARIVVEKPFGRDTRSAAELSAVLGASFPEERIFRIDHYLGKESVENLLVFRFGNSLLEPVWNRSYVHSVQVTLAESIGVEGRGRFYETVGALRDVVQNHALQVVTLLAMEPPVAADADALLDERAKVLKAMRPLDPAHVIRGQYLDYRHEDGVDPASPVETYVGLRLEIDSWRWAGVPFFVRAGKSLSSSVTECVVRLNAPPRLLFSRAGDAQPEANQLVFRLGGDEGVTFQLQAKAPGDDLVTRSVDLDVSFDHALGPRQEAYERLLFDALEGDRRRFSRVDVVDAAWRVVQPVLDHPPPLHFYEPGTWGPDEADALAAGYGGWHEPPMG